MPKISVIVPIYNSEEYLDQCLTDLVNQTLKDIEIILVDDCSTDSSLKICEKYASNDNRIKIIKQNRNSGAGECRNTGMKNAVGEFLFFFDADDFLEPETLEKLYKKSVLERADITICRSKSYIQDQNIFTNIENSLDRSCLKGYSVFSPTDIKDNLFQFCVGWTWDKLFRREFTEKEKLIFQNLRQSNDLTFVFSSLACAEKITYIDDRCVFHRYHSDSLANTRNKAPECFYLAQIELKNILEKKGIYNTFEKSFVNFCLKFSKWHISTIKNNKIMKRKFKQLLKEINFDKYSEADIYDYSLYLYANRIYHPFITMIKQMVLIFKIRTF